MKGGKKGNSEEGEQGKKREWKKRQRPMCIAYPLTMCRNAPRT